MGTEDIRLFAPQRIAQIADLASEKRPAPMPRIGADADLQPIAFEYALAVDRWIQREQGDPPAAAQQFPDMPMDRRATEAGQAIAGQALPGQEIVEIGEGNRPQNADASPL
jgi:hypothetical protein